MNIIDFKAQNEIQTDMKRITEILNSQIFSRGNCRNPLLESAFIELIIRLRDLMYKCDKLGNRISFQDDIIKIKDQNSNAGVEDITDAIGFVRNAACHIESGKNLIDQSCVFIFNVFYGKGKMKVAQKEYTSDYSDDICYFYGEQKLYLHRHLIRAFKESQTVLGKYLK